jgi:hypothetical protein
MKKRQSDKGQRKKKTPTPVRVAESHRDKEVSGELEKQLKLGRELMREYRKTLELLAKT